MPKSNEIARSKLTRKQILALPAGRKMDRLIADFMGDWTDGDWWYSKDGSKECHNDNGPKRYSTEISKVWEVVEWLTDRYGWVEVTQQRGGACECCLGTLDGDTYAATAPGGTAPLAICRTALLTIIGA